MPHLNCIGVPKAAHDKTAIENVRFDMMGARRGDVPSAILKAAILNKQYC